MHETTLIFFWVCFSVYVCPFCCENTIMKNRHFPGLNYTAFSLILDWYNVQRMCFLFTLCAFKNT